jgi:hypothetical protein
MITSSQKQELDKIKGEPGQSLRSFVKAVMEKMEPLDVVMFIECDIAVVRNYVSTFSASFGLRTFQSKIAPGGLKVRRIR